MEGGRALDQVPRAGWSPSMVTAEADLNHFPSQTDFKAADANVNTDQDIEKNLVCIKALHSGPGSALGKGAGAVLPTFFLSK